MSETLQPPPDGDVIRSGRYEGGIIAMTVLAFAVVWLRMYTRIFLSRNTGWDDWIMFAASIIMVVTNAFLVTSYHLGLGRHIYYVPPADIPETFKWLWAAEPTNLFAVYLVRLSIGLFLLRLIPLQKRVHVWLIWGTIAALTISDIFISINYFFECRPIRKVWLPETPGSCFDVMIDKGATWLYQAVSIPADFVYMYIPISLFWRLQVATKTKWALIVICCLGVFTTICAIVKTALLPVLFGSDPDKTWAYAELVLWAPLELCVGMICGTIPALRPLFGSHGSKSQKTPHGYQADSSPSCNPNSLSGRGIFRGSSSRGLGSTFATTKPQREHLSSTSEERIMAATPQELNTIRKTVEYDVNNERAQRASQRSSEGGRYGWDAV